MHCLIKTINKLIYLLIISAMLCSRAYAGSTIIKIALITPEGSTWTNMLFKMTDEVKAKSNNEVAFKIYAGGISGDELDVIRKMETGLVHAAGFSGVGLVCCCRK